MGGVIADVGTADGKFTYQLAKEHPDKLVIGVDPAQKPPEELSAKIYKKADKGSLPNALFVLANVEDLPQELTGVANQVFINFPWSGLLRGVVLGEEKTWSNIKRICQPQAYIDLIFGYASEREQKTMTDFSLPPVTLEYIQSVMLPKVERYGFRVLESKEVELDDLKHFPSTWSKKLSFGGDRKFFYIQLQSSSK